MKKNTKGLGKNGKLTNTKINIMQNYFGIDLGSNVGNFAAMKSACFLRYIIFLAIKIIAQNLRIHGVSIKKINKTTPITTNQGVIYPLMFEQFFLFINPFASLRCWRNAFMAKHKTQINR